MLIAGRIKTNRLVFVLVETRVWWERESLARVTQEAAVAAPYDGKASVLEEVKAESW